MVEAAEGSAGPEENEEEGAEDEEMEEDEEMQDDVDEAVQEMET